MSDMRRLYVYRQNPRTGCWETTGYVRIERGGSTPSFSYIESFAEQNPNESIDPINLPFDRGALRSFPANRYQGLHDVLRDATPDGWGQHLLCEFEGFRRDARPIDFLTGSGDHDRWGSLAFGNSLKPPAKIKGAMRQLDLDLLAREINALELRKPALDSKLRKYLLGTSLGGARPKASFCDDHGDEWIAKPRSIHDSEDSPLIEYFCQTWAQKSGINAAQTEIRSTTSGHLVLLSKRFDRAGGIRQMCISGATAMGYEYPAPSLDGGVAPSYPLLAAKLKDMGVPEKDRQELFRRMVFNALCGNDDDHAKNHAAVYDPQTGLWRLSAAYDLAPSWGYEVKQLGMCTSVSSKEITRDALLSGWAEFSFDSKDAASKEMDSLIECARESFTNLASILSTSAIEGARNQIETTCSALMHTY